MVSFHADVSDKNPITLKNDGQEASENSAESSCDAQSRTTITPQPFLSLNNKRRLRLHLGLTAKFLIGSLALLVISLSILSYIALDSLNNVGDKTTETIVSLGEYAASEGGIAVEIMSGEKIQDKAKDVAREVQTYLKFRPNWSMDEIIQDELLRSIAIQQFGTQGYTSMYIKSTKLFSPSPESLLGMVSNDISSKQSKEKFMYVEQVEGTEFAIAVVTYIDEFMLPSQEIRNSIISSTLKADEYVEQQRQNIHQNIVIATVGLLAVLAVLAFLVTKTITRPILALTESSKLLTEGDLTQRVHVKTGDEIERLAEQFNSMAEVLEHSHIKLEQKVAERTAGEIRRSNQLRMLNDVAQHINSVLNIDELLPYITNTIQRVFNYDSVNIFLLDSESGQLVLKAVAGKAKHSVGFRINMSSIEANASSFGILLIDEEKNTVDYPADLIDSHMHLAMNIESSERRIGLLQIYRDRLSPFDEVDISTVQTLAGHIAVAIENARLYRETRDIAILEERNRMAREIHDILAQGCTGIILQLQVATESLVDDDRKLAMAHTQRALELARYSLREARRCAKALRPQVLEKLSLVDAMGQEIKEFVSDTNIRANFYTLGSPHEVPVNIEIALLHILQECLTNIKRHSRASHVETTLSYENESIVLCVSDDGIGIDISDVGKGFGLTSMRERAEVIGGKFVIHSGKGDGTRIEVIIPLQRE